MMKKRTMTKIMTGTKMKKMMTKRTMTRRMRMKRMKMN